MPSIPRPLPASDRGSERKRLIAWRQALAPQQRQLAERAIGERLLARLAGRPACVLALFWPIRGEPDLSSALGELAERGFTFALPRVDGPDQALSFGRWSPGQALEPGGFGVMLPQPFEPVRPACLVIPCVGFTREGHRLGYGAGFYDRTLAQGPVDTIGVAFDGTELRDFAPQPHDRRLDCVITETRCIER